MNNYTKRSDFPAELPTTTASYCPNCHDLLAYERVKVTPGFKCSNCGDEIARALVWDDQIEQSFDTDNCLVHKSVGVFLINDKKEVLLFSLNKFPYGHTISAGHVDRGESSDVAARRELKEELGLEVDELEYIASEKIAGDSCSRGADVHEWDAYWAQYSGQEIILNDEGVSYSWFSSDKLPSDLTKPVADLLHNRKVWSKLFG